MRRICSELFVLYLVEHHGTVLIASASWIYTRPCPFAIANCLFCCIIRSFKHYTITYTKRPIEKKDDNYILFTTVPPRLRCLTSVILLSMPIWADSRLFADLLIMPFIYNNQRVVRLSCPAQRRQYTSPPLPSNDRCQTFHHTNNDVL